MSWADIKQYVADQLYGVIRWTVSTATVDPKTRWLGVEGHPVDPSDPQSQWYQRLFQHYGFASSPKKGSELITAAIGGEGNNTAIIAEYTSGKGPDDLQEGDVSVYGDKDGQILRMNEAGDTSLQTAGAALRMDTLGQVNIDSESSKDVIFNGGSQNVARKGDHAKVTFRMVQTPVVGAPVPTFTLTVSVVNGLSATVLFQFTSPGAITIPTMPGVPYDVEVDSEIFEGAAHVLS